MSTLHAIFLFALISLSSVARATGDVQFEGNPGWKISNQKCTFRVPGKIVNRSPAGTVSGTLRLCLWVSRQPPFRAAATG